MSDLGSVVSVMFGREFGDVGGRFRHATCVVHWPMCFEHYAINWELVISRMVLYISEVLYRFSGLLMIEEYVNQPCI